MTTATPIRKQYLDIKRRHADAILLFRIGDFYEAFEIEGGWMLAGDVMGRGAAAASMTALARYTIRTAGKLVGHLKTMQPCSRYCDQVPPYR